MSLSSGVILGIFDNPVFQSELLFLLIIVMLFGVIGVLGRSMTLGAFGSFLAFVHIVTAVGSNVPELNIAMWAIMGLLVLFMAFRLWGHVRGGGSPA